MTSAHRRALRRYITFLAIAGVFFGALFLIFQRLRLRINSSASMPMGIYRADARGSLVEFCPPQPYGLLSLTRGYRGRGVCPDGGQPLVKPVAARAGEVVIVSAAGTTVGRYLIPNTAPHTRDSGGRTLTPWPAGIYHLRAGQIWVVSPHHRLSFDSRYFGPLDSSLIIERLEPVPGLTW